MPSLSAATSYSSSDLGYPVPPIEVILADHETMLDRIKLCYGADRNGFERDREGRGEDDE